jgi:hypothetical protein
MTRHEDHLDDLEPDPADAETVVGGAVPRPPSPPSGPVPIPYPNPDEKKQPR